MPMEIRGDLSYWIDRIRAKVKEGAGPRLCLPATWLILSPRNWAEIKHLLTVNDVLRYQSQSMPDEPAIFGGLKIAIVDLYNSNADFLEVA